MNILIIFCIVVAIIGIYILIRNYYVYKYRCQIYDKCYSIVSKQLDSIPTDESWEVFNEQLKVHNEYDEIWDSIREQNSYNKMLYSFKPLKDKYWFTEKQINWLKLYK